MESPWQEGITRLQVDKILFWTKFSEKTTWKIFGVLIKIEETEICKENSELFFLRDFLPLEYWTAQPFEYRTNGHHLVFLCTGLVFEWLVLHINRPFEYLTIWNLNIIKFRLQMFQVFKWSRIWNFSFCQRTVGQLTLFKVQVEQSTMLDAKLFVQTTSGTLNQDKKLALERANLWNKLVRMFRVLSGIYTNRKQAFNSLPGVCEFF